MREKEQMREIERERERERERESESPNINQELTLTKTKATTTNKTSKQHTVLQRHSFEKVKHTHRSPHQEQTPFIPSGTSVAHEHLDKFFLHDASNLPNCEGTTAWSSRQARAVRTES